MYQLNNSKTGLDLKYPIEFWRRFKKFYTLTNNLAVLIPLLINYINII